MKHKIEITETLQRVIEVEASTMEDAERAALGLHRSGEVVLSADDFVFVEVKCVQERKFFSERFGRSKLRPSRVRTSRAESRPTVSRADTLRTAPSERFRSEIARSFLCAGTKLKAT